MGVSFHFNEALPNTVLFYAALLRFLSLLETATCLFRIMQDTACTRWLFFPVYFPIVLSLWLGRFLYIMPRLLAITGYYPFLCLWHNRYLLSDQFLDVRKGLDVCLAGKAYRP